MDGGVCGVLNFLSQNGLLSYSYKQAGRSSGSVESVFTISPVN